MPKSKADNPDRIDFAEVQIPRDQFGQMSRRAWSCLTLDFADKAAPMFGALGIEFYYRMAQDVESWETKWQGEGEAQARMVMDDTYVKPSLGEYVVAHKRMGLTPPPLPIPVLPRLIIVAARASGSCFEEDWAWFDIWITRRYEGYSYGPKESEHWYSDQVYCEDLPRLLHKFNTAALSQRIAWARSFRAAWANWLAWKK